MYELQFDTKAIEFLNKTEQKVKERIFRKILTAKKEPFRYFTRLTNRSEYKLRVGHYRIIADIDTKTKVIKIRLIMHRKNVYKRHI